jgi:hypothetical protein
MAITLHVDVADKFGQQKAKMPTSKPTCRQIFGARNATNRVKPKAQNPDKNLSDGWR